ncbi:MAG TPA: NADH-quinone oxidoreductase subunit J [Burkholderiaceae bacterium]|jgi:NADH-quinone oxidoreductase subunit J|nr:NADH-quinone oxidoreductase subunit J [Burkholderiaceae bacterium]
MNFVTVLFYLLAFVLIVAAARVVTARSPVTAVLHLILTFFTASMLWILLGAEFLGLLLVIVYVGAVLVMFLFVVMMLDVRMDNLREGFKAYLPLGIVIAAVMAIEMAFVAGTTWHAAGPQKAMGDDYNNTRALGEVMYTDYVFAVQVGGVILLVGMVAAIALTLRKRSDVKRTDPSSQVRVRARDRVRMANIQAPRDNAAAGNAQGEAK